MCCAPIVLKALTTLAPGTQAATCSPAEVVCPMTSPERSGWRGFVASTRTLPRREPAAVSASLAAGHGVARTTTSVGATASRTVAARTRPPADRTTSWTLVSIGSRTPKTISCPAEAHPWPRALPTLPAPMMAIFMTVVLRGPVEAYSACFSVLDGAYDQDPDGRWGDDTRHASRVSPWPAEHGKERW